MHQNVVQEKAWCLLVNIFCINMHHFWIKKARETSHFLRLFNGSNVGIGRFALFGWVGGEKNGTPQAFFPLSP